METWRDWIRDETVAAAATTASYLAAIVSRIAAAAKSNAMQP
jgi:hypothetical protein